LDRSGLRTVAERRLWDAFPRGEAVDLGPGDPTAEGFDPDTWGGDRCVRGEVIARLLLGASERRPGYVARISLAGVRITGIIDLIGGQTDYDFILHRCWVDEPICLATLSSKRVMFYKTRFPRLEGNGWQASGLVSFESSRCEGAIRMRNAHITGQLNFSGATLNNPNGMALDADGATVNGSMFCNRGFIATGEVRLIGAHITSQLNFSGATLSNPGRPALYAERITVNGDVVCNERFTATGGVLLPGAHITGQLNFSGATLSNPCGAALAADEITVNGGMVCDGGFTATGEVRLFRAHIAGQLNFAGATLNNPGGWALIADGIAVNGSMFCRNGFTANGQVRLPGARITAQVVFTHATLSSPSESRPFGIYTIPFSVADPDRIALYLESAECLHLLLPEYVQGWIDLTWARFITIRTPTRLKIRMWLTGLTYTNLDPDLPVSQRIAWLRRDPGGFHPQPYEQLATYYRSIGRDRDARRVLLAKHRTRRWFVSHSWELPHWPRSLHSVLTIMRPVLATIRRIPGWIYDVLSGYGYFPERALAWLLVAIATGALMLHDVAPTTTSHTWINALLLAMDATLPTGPFGIREQANLTGLDYGIALALQVVGYILALAVIPALTRTLNRASQ
jgi:hypothetical protein